MPSAQALRAGYEQATGQRAERFGWFESLARYKMAAIMGNNLARHRSGRYDDPYQEKLVPTIRRLLESATELLAGP
jgi:aminoglycoside phosphotransferase (APT) family kinase protein